jgi:hypothetical protein
VLPLVLERLSHPKEAVRKKAIMALHHFTNLDPTRTGALAGGQLAQQGWRRQKHLQQQQGVPAKQPQQVHPQQQQSSGHILA